MRHSRDPVPGAGPATQRERRFAELWAADPEHNGPRAARGAGYGGNDNVLRTTACRVLKRPAVVAHIANLSREAMARIKAEREQAVAGIQECLEYLTTVKRARLADFIDDQGSVIVDKLREAPGGLVRRYRKTTTTVESGESVCVNERMDLELESAMTAAVKLLEWHRGADAPAGVSATTFLQALSSLPTENLKVLLEAMRAAKAIDVTPAPAQLEEARTP